VRSSHSNQDELRSLLKQTEGAAEREEGFVDLGGAVVPKRGAGLFIPVRAASGGRRSAVAVSDGIGGYRLQIERQYLIATA
jgi:hypothetical protein